MAKNNAFFISKNFNKEKFFPKLKINNHPDQTDSNLRESRDELGKLSYLSGISKFKEIQNCKVIDLSSTSNQEVQLKDLV